MSTGSQEDQVDFEIPPIQDFYAWAEQYGVEKSPDVAQLTDDDYQAISQTLVGQTKAKQVLADQDVTIKPTDLELQANVSEVGIQPGDEAYFLAAKEARRLHIEAGKREQVQKDEQFIAAKDLLSEAESINTQGDRDGALKLLQQVVDICKSLATDPNGDANAGDIPLSEAGNDVAQDNLDDEINNAYSHTPSTQIPVDDDDGESLYAVGNPPITDDNQDHPNNNANLDDEVENAYSQGNAIELDTEDVESLFGDENIPLGVENDDEQQLVSQPENDNHNNNDNNPNLDVDIENAYRQGDAVELDTEDVESLFGGDADDDGSDDENDPQNNDQDDNNVDHDDDQIVINEMEAETPELNHATLDNAEAQLYSNEPIDNAEKQALDLRQNMLSYYQRAGVADWPAIQKNVVDKNRTDAEKKFTDHEWEDAAKAFLHTIKTMAHAVNQRKKVRDEVQSARDTADLITDKNQQDGSPGRYDGIMEELKRLVGNLDRYENELTTKAFNQNLKSVLRDSRKIEGLYRKIDLGALLDLMTIDVQQGDYFAPGHDHPLLDEIGIEGVCLAMVLDWAAGGGSQLDPGDAKKAQIDSHLVNKQAKYLLELSMLGRGAYKQDEVIKHLKLNQKLTSANEAFEQAQLLLEGVSHHHKVVDDRADECAQQASIAASAIRNVKATMAGLTGAADSDEKKSELDRLSQDLEFYSSEQHKFEKEAASWDDVAKSLDTLRKRVKKIVDTFKDDQDEAVELVMGCKDQMTKLALAIFRLDKQRQGITGVANFLPDSQLRELGIEVAPGGDEMQLGDNAKFFSTQEVIAFLKDKFVETTPIAGTKTSQVTVTFPLQNGEPGHHAIGIRIDRPEKDKWNIELMDPNFGGFKVSSLKDFSDLVKSLYENQYRGEWTRVKAVNLTGSKSDNDDSGDPQSDLDMLTDHHVTLEDWEAALKCYGPVMDIANMPIKPRNELLTLRDKAFKLMPIRCLPKGTSPKGHPDPDSMTDFDWLLAKSYTSRLKEDSIRLLQIYNEFNENKEESRASINWETETPAGVAWAQACASWTDGEIVAANTKMKEALMLTVQNEFGGFDDESYDDL